MLRKLLTRYLAVAAIACGLAAGNASAATYAIGDLTAAGTFSGGTPTIPVGSFSDSWTFSLSGGPNTFVGFFSSLFTPTAGLLSPLSIILHGPGGAMPWSVSTSVGSYGAQLSFFSAPGPSFTLPSGAYHLDIVGTATHPASYSVDLAASVPEPGQWLMLFAGIALIGTIVRRRAR